MKKAAIYGQSYAITSVKEIKTLLEVLEKNKIEFYIENEFLNLLIENKSLKDIYKSFKSFNDLDDSFDIMFTIGGDGTFLRSATHIRNLNIPILAINTGRLGFLAIVPKDVTVISVRQSEPLGLGHAVLSAKPIIGDNPFAVLLPDVLVDKYLSDPAQDNLAQMVKRFEETSISQIMVEAIPEEDVNKYGVVDIEGVKLRQGEFAKIIDMVEKPEIDKAPSNLAVTGRYVLSSDIWDLLETTLPGAGDEIQLTDAIAMLMEKETVEAFHMTGKSHDCGSKLGYMKANVEYGLRHPELAGDLKQHITELLK